MNNAVCLDTSIWIKYLCPDEQEEAATLLVTNILTAQTPLIAPSFSWAEIGSVLRKKIRSQLLTSEEATTLYQAYNDFSINYIDSQSIRERAWEIANQYNIPTLYDSVFLACAEASSATYWTADKILLKQLNSSLSYVYSLF
jgi:predicted nucleic acid-binding protein